jgi:hypothetical protein
MRMATVVVFERGLEYGSGPNSIRLESTATTLGQVIEQARNNYNVRPVLFREQAATDDPAIPQAERWRLFTLDGMPDVDLVWSNLLLCGGFSPPLLQQQHNLAYVVGAVVYHCKCLADCYALIARNMLQISSKPGYPDVQHSSYGYQLEPYYELDALLTAARRAYDASRYVLWTVYGPGRGHLPSNFKKTIPACKKLPQELRETLVTSWETYGEELTRYRDCITHYSPVDFALGTASMQRLPDGIWSVLMRIPDNPAAKSQAAFTFARRLDALTYGWELCNEIVRIATAIVKSLPRDSSKPASLPIVVTKP